jgi:YVTN family beta-propeller protein
VGCRMTTTPTPGSVAGGATCIIDFLCPAAAITPDGKTAYVVNLNSRTVTPIRTATNTALKPVKVRGLPVAIAITP